MTPTATRILAAVIALVGVLAIIAGVVYLTETVNHLPSFFPGHGPGHFHRPKRGYAGIIAGVILILAAAGVVMSGRRRVIE